MSIGYARVSSGDQTLDLQLDALTKAQTSRAFTRTASGAKSDRPTLREAVKYLHPGDTLANWRLDRSCCSIVHLISAVTELNKRGIAFRTPHRADRHHYRRQPGLSRVRCPEQMPWN